MKGLSGYFILSRIQVFLLFLNIHMLIIHLINFRKKTKLKYIFKKDEFKFKMYIFSDIFVPILYFVNSNSM